MRDLRERSSQLLSQLAETHSGVVSQREERELLASLEMEFDEPAPDDPAESHLTDLLRRVSSFDRSLADFASVLHYAHRQIGTSHDFPDKVSANHLAVKMAELRAREDERQRFARDIHDGPAQAFANAIIGLEFIERAMKSERGNVVEESIGEVQRIKRTMREGLTEIRRFIFDHRPTMLADRGLAPTLVHYVQSYQSIFPAIVNIEVDDKIGRLEADHELTAFRVVQESIQNACKHARPTKVDVQVSKMPDGKISVSIEDDGRGFDPERVRAHAMGGAGLQGMQERTDLVGGILDIQSQRGHGTTVLLTLPPSRNETE